MKSGATVMIEGTQAELAALVSLIEGDGESAPAAVRASKPTEGLRSTPTGLIAELIGSGFFSRPRTISEVRTKLEEMGHFYPVTNLSPVLLRFVKKRELRRIKTDKQWTYVR
jgi:hypothetical protein